MPGTKKMTTKDKSVKKPVKRIAETGDVEQGNALMMRGQNLESLEEMLGMTTFELIVFLGKLNPKGGIHGENNQKLISSSYFSLFVRFASEHPEYFSQTNKVTFKDLYEYVRDHFEPGLSVRRFSAYMGQPSINGSQYKSGKAKPSAQFRTVINHVYNGIVEHGVQFWNDWIEACDQEARSRGFVDGLEGPAYQGSWRTEAYDKELEEHGQLNKKE